MRRVCFFHAGCPDGFGAAWAAWRAWGSAGSYVPRGHEDALDPELYRGDLVAFVDIAPPNKALAELAGLAAQVLVLDHHVSARDRYFADPGLHDALVGGPHRIHFDLEHSGAILSWNHFHPDAAPPDLLRYVEDQDLWSWKLPSSEEVNAALGAYPRDFETWEKLAARPIEELVAEGMPLVRANRIEVERAVQTAHPIAIGPERAEAVNARSLRAPIGHALAKRAAYGRAWGVVYRIQSERVDASIYAIGDLDVSRVAERYGGGGHRSAAGFTVSLRRWLEEFVV